MTSRPRSTHARVDKAVAEENITVESSSDEVAPAAPDDPPAPVAAAEPVEEVANLPGPPEQSENLGGGRCANCGASDLRGGVIVDEPQVSYAAFCASCKPVNREPNQ